MQSMTVWSLLFEVILLSRAEQKEKRRQQILETGLDLFVAKGFAATRITDIATAMEMSKGMMFNYFSTKEELYETLINIGLEKSGEMLNLPCEDALSFFSYAARAVLDGARKNPWTAKMFVLMNDAWRSDSLPDHLYIPNTLGLSILSRGRRMGGVRNWYVKPRRVQKISH